MRSGLLIALAGAMLFTSVLLATSLAQSQQGAPLTVPALTLFHEKGCSYCHGEHLEGSARGPNLKNVGGRLNLQQIEKQIEEGGDAMPAFRDSLETGEVQSLAHELSRQKTKTAQPRSAHRRSRNDLLDRRLAWQLLDALRAPAV